MLEEEEGAGHPARQNKKSGVISLLHGTPSH